MNAPRPSRRLLRRGVFLGVVGLVVLTASSLAMPENATARNDLVTWLTVLGVFGGLGMVLAGAIAFVAGLVKRLREPTPPRDPNTTRPTLGQAAAIVTGSVVLGLSTCGAFATALESNSGYAAALLIGGLVGFVAAGILFFYGVVVLVRRLRGK